MKRILNVVGARPNFMKIAPIHRAMKKFDSEFEPILVHTGQHYDERMSKLFFEDLQLPEPDIYLGVGSGSHAEQTAKIMLAFEKVVLDTEPDLVIVVGDVNSTVACSLVAAKLWVPVAHVEAGLRSFDRRMPEEINRLVTDALSDYLFTTEKSGNENLMREGIPATKIYYVGNVMIDSLIFFLEKARKSNILEQLKLEPQGFALVTLHRPSNVDDPENFKKILDAFEEIQKDIPIIFPVHPRTEKNLNHFGLQDRVANIPNLRIIPPVGYLDFMQLMQNSKFVMTDSGGIQEETTYLRIPCLTIRENTERPVTVELGTNELVGTDTQKIIRNARKILAGEWKKGAVPELWDGHTAERIVKILKGD
ncbi:MAG: UDP-N-acetylglucosamine 2-epimerase (non-hydrolyzing) [Calditrichaeota bacterium]|nr:UDP-N-acetylglucosamine 2-epimerase (non-hydrolyzing) [Calditrichota bacterium]